MVVTIQFEKLQKPISRYGKTPLIYQAWLLVDGKDPNLSAVVGSSHSDCRQQLKDMLTQKRDTAKQELELATDILAAWPKRNQKGASDDPTT